MNICKNFQQISSKIFAIFHLCYILRDVHQIVQSCFMVYADVAELADAHGSGPCSARNVGSTPTDGTIFFANQGVNHSKISEIFCGYGITAVHQPSKLDIRVRLPLPAPVAKLNKICQTV